jgi:cytochrome c
MQGAIAKAKSAGTELKCSNCHVDQKTFGLRPNAVDDLASWL